jgi:hypothetical protein
MDHELAARTLAAERYLLHEMDPAEEQAFEEHFVCCQACVAELDDLALLVETMRAILAQVRT